MLYQEQTCVCPCPGHNPRAIDVFLFPFIVPDFLITLLRTVCPMLPSSLLHKTQCARLTSTDSIVMHVPCPFRCSHIELDAMVTYTIVLFFPSSSVKSVSESCLPLPITQTMFPYSVYCTRFYSICPCIVSDTTHNPLLYSPTLYTTPPSSSIKYTYTQLQQVKTTYRSHSLTMHTAHTQVNTVTHETHPSHHR